MARLFIVEEVDSSRALLLFLRGATLNTHITDADLSQIGRSSNDDIEDISLCSDQLRIRAEKLQRRGLAGRVSDTRQEPRSGPEYPKTS